MLEAKRRFWQELQNQGDSNQDDTVSLEEWLIFWEKIITEATTTGKTADWVSQIHFALFQALDINGDGSIGLDEYALYLQSIRVNQDSQLIFQKVDADGNGKIDLEEFGSIIYQWLMSTDPSDSINDFVMGSISG